MTTYTEIPLNKLKLSPSNARTDPGDVSSLAASIRAVGLVSGLAVTKNGRGYLVEAGGRRLAALQQLHAAGHIPKNHPVPCLVFDCPDLARSLAENTERQPMNPVQQFQAFARLLNEGRTEAEVAEAFSVTVQFLRQRMKLATLVDEAIQAYNDGRANLEQLGALTYGTPEQQRAIVAQSYLPHWTQIRDQLRGTVIGGEDKRVRLVTLQAYKDAGGSTQEDLFASNVIILDEDLLDRLVADRLQAEADKQLANGAKFAEITSDRWSTDIRSRFEGALSVFNPTPEQSAEIKSIEERCRAIVDEIDELGDDAPRADELGNTLETLEARLVEVRDAAHTTQDNTDAGVLIYVKNDGTVGVDDVVRIGSKANTNPAESGGEDTQPAAKPLTVRNSIELGIHREAALALAIVKSPHIGLAIAAHALDQSILEDNYALKVPMVGHIKPTNTVRPSDMNDALKAITWPALEARRQDEMLPPLSWYLQQTDEQLATIITHCIACAITDPSATDSKSQYDAVSQGAKSAITDLIAYTHLDLADYWSPSPEWLKSYGKANLTRALINAGEDEENLKGRKLTDLVDYAHPILTNARWLPDEFVLEAP